jgi:hypothetical protein
MIGEPDVERSNGSIWIYEQPRHLALAWGIAPGGAGGGWFDEYQFMVVEFDGDFVSHVERVEDETGCTSTGICRPLQIGQGLEVGSHASSSYSDYAVVASKREDDKLAKAFTNSPDFCSLYIHTRDDLTKIGIDSSPLMLITNTTYIHILLKPGMHSIRGWSYPHAYHFEGAELRINCAGGDVIYSEEYIERGFFNPHWQNLFVTLKEDIGQSEISRRNMLISNVLDEIQARQYANIQEISHKPETCALYIYRTGSPWCLLLIKVGSLDAFYLEDGNYINPGMLPESLVVPVIARETKPPKVFGKSVPKEIQLECKAGSSQFVNVEFNTSFMHGCADDSAIDITTVDEDVARAALKDRIHAPFKGNAE